MKRVVKAILFIFGILCAVISIYFIITIIGASDDIIGAYENMTSASSSKPSMKTRFISTYTIATGDKSLMFAAGLSESDIGIEISDEGLPVTDDDEETDPGNGVTPAPTPGDTTNTEIDYQPESQQCGLYYQSQEGKGSIYWSELKGGGGGKYSSDGCAIFALYAAARNMGGNGVTGQPGGQLEDFLLKIQGVGVSSSTRHLVGHTPDKGHKASVYNSLSSMWGMTETQIASKWPTSDGNYLVYYTHQSGGSNHWVYVNVSQGAVRMCNILNSAERNGAEPNVSYILNSPVVQCWQISKK